jgi:hypothetical protein
MVTFTISSDPPVKTICRWVGLQRRAGPAMAARPDGQKIETEETRGRGLRRPRISFRESLDAEATARGSTQMCDTAASRSGLEAIADARKRSIAAFEGPRTM